jgi:hypothetical protein
LCKKDYETEEESRAQQRAVGPLMSDDDGFTFKISKACGIEHCDEPSVYIEGYEFLGQLSDCQFVKK